MHHRGYAVRGQRRSEPGAVVEIALDKRAPTHGFAVAARQVVVYDRAITRGGQGLAGMAADIAGAASDEDRLRHQVNTGYRWQTRVQRGTLPVSSPAGGCVGSPHRGAG